MFSPFWIKLVLGILYIGMHLHWNAFALECICIGMYLEYYSIKRFFCHFLKNFVIFLILVLFVWC